MHFMESCWHNDYLLIKIWMPFAMACLIGSPWMTKNTFCVEAVSAESITKWASELSGNLKDVFESATKYGDIVKSYSSLADADVFDAGSELKSIKRQVEIYLRERAKMAWDAKVSLESKEIRDNLSEVELNDPLSKDFVRYLNAKRQSDAAVVFLDGHFGGTIEVNATREVHYRKNVNFYGIPTSSEASAVHVPTPVYNRNPYVLERIEWSDIDQVYRKNRERMKDLSFQKFCSESGFMRYFPAAPWIWDSKEMELDLFDCRSTEWFIDAATMSKNVLILLDLSGSMLGQRFEIARQTIESILDTLSDNDFFNVMAFSKNTNFLDECAEEILLQATMRNKKLIWSRLANISSEGKAEYEKALSKAFTTLMNLPGVTFWRTKEELAREREEDALDPDLHYIALEDNILVLPQVYAQAIKKFTGNSQQMGCNDVIMLITDGAPGFFKEVFDLYNKEKRIRFFSFLVGEEATDFEQVRWMACENRGFMVHVNNLADVQEKVQHYVKVMSRPISRQSASIHQENAIWSGTARERMSNEFVISVSYPVVLDGTFMGVSAVSIPLLELSQIAHPSMIGSSSYFFMLDNNNYAMFHPQLRPLDAVTGEIKPTYNNMEFAEVDIQMAYSKTGSKASLSCNSNEHKEMNTLFAVESLRRVYRQKNHYYAECIEGTHFTVALAVAENDNKRLKRTRPLDLSRVEMTWFRDHNWRLHPKWRYCLLNDSDVELNAEVAFTAYARQMRTSGELPRLCRERRKLVDRLLLDLQASATLNSIWDIDWQKNRDNGVHLTFLATSSGLIRFMNQSLGDLFYEHPEGFAENNTDFAYKHFVLELNQRTTEEEYFKRAVRQRGKIVFDINRQTRMWQNANQTSAYGNIETETLLGLAYKAVYVDDALVGVVGMEFLYDKLAEKMKQLGCSPDDEHTRCFLLDEHAYVVYTSQKDTLYSDFIKANTWHSSITNTTQGRRRRPATRQMAQQHQQLLRQKADALDSGKAMHQSVVLGSFFGHINRVAEWTMEILVKKGFYTETTFTDNQAMCDPEPIVLPVTASATIVKPFLCAFRTILLFLSGSLELLHQLCLISSSLLGLSPIPIGPFTTQAFTTSFKPTIEGRYSCKAKSKFYLANPAVHHKGGSQAAALLEENYSERPCKHSAAQCAVKVYASWVQSTNLLLVVVKQGSRSQCYDNRHCAMSVPPSLPFGFQKIEANFYGDSNEEEEEVYEHNRDASRKRRDNSDKSASVIQSKEEEEVDTVDRVLCQSSMPKKRKNVVQCLRDDFLEDESKLACSKGARAQHFIFWLLPWLLLLLLNNG